MTDDTWYAKLQKEKYAVIARWNQLKAVAALGEDMGVDLREMTRLERRFKNIEEHEATLARMIEYLVEGFWRLGEGRSDDLGENACRVVQMCDLLLDLDPASETLEKMLEEQRDSTAGQRKAIVEFCDTGPTLLRAVLRREIDWSDERKRQRRQRQKRMSELKAEWNHIAVQVPVTPLGSGPVLIAVRTRNVTRSTI